MASELLKNKIFIQRLKEPDVPNVKFNLADTGFEELITLPEPKPQELLDIQEENRKGRLLDSLNTIGGGLMDESVDFIKRENFATKGRPENLITPRESLKRLAEIIQQADIDDELEYLMPTPEAQLKSAKALGRKQIVRHKKGKMTQSLRQDFNKLRTDENSIKIVADLLGEDVEYILDIIDEVDNFSSEAKLKAMMTGSRIKEKDTRAKFEKIEKWITSNAKKFDDPAELKKAVNKRFGSNNILNQTAKKKGVPLFTQGFTNEILGLKGFSGDTSRFSNTLLDNVYKTTIYNFNPKVRKQLTNEITKVLSGGPAKVTQEAKTLIKNNPLLKKFGFDQEINGPIAKVLFKEIGEDMYKNLQTFKRPRFGTERLIRYLSNEVDPKYKSMFVEASRAIKAFQDNNRMQADKFLKKGTKIMYDHKIPVSLIKNGYADPIEYIKLQPTSEYFNVDIKNQQFDKPVSDLVRKYEKATGPTKDILFNQILEKRDNFNKKYANYLKDVSITRDNTGKIKFSTSDKTPVFTKDTDVLKEYKGQKSSFEKAKTPTAKDSKNIAKLLASFGFKCGLAEGTTCDNPMAYLKDIKKQQDIATKGSGNAAAKAVKKINAGKAILREFIGPAALGVELALAVPITYFGYKAGLPPARIFSDATYGIIGDTEKARLKKIAREENIDTKVIDNIFNFRKKSGAMQTLAMQEDEFRGPDDEMQFPQQYEKGKEDFEEAVERFIPTSISDKSPEEVLQMAKENFKKQEGETQKVEGIAAEDDAGRRADRESRINYGGIGEYLTDGIIPEEEPILPVFDFQEESTRMDLSEGGPNDPSRRTFLKFMAGIASLPFVGKFFKAAKAPKVVKLANTTTKMPEWFPSFIDRAFEKGIAKKIDADITEVEIPELPTVKVRKYDDGRIEVEGKNGYGEPYEIDYTPPGYELVDETTGKAVKTPGEFQANDTVYRRVGPEGDDFDVDFEVVDDVEQILGGDSTALESFAKGKKDNKYTIGQRRLDEADQLGERADEFQLDDIDIDYED
tara:strand:+ start:1034 stop:4099 length:3066 start_codon:yes stop_codon:yes gene_type:complete